jgi:hypothetical protein
VHDSGLCRFCCKSLGRRPSGVVGSKRFILLRAPFGAAALTHNLQ